NTRRQGYWPDFRGPNRDGRYDETAIRTDWPESGLPALWRQPIGLGYASFVVADGRAFTIEQRRHQEVVAAYDVETGRELWTHGWDGAFNETTGAPVWSSLDDAQAYTSPMVVTLAGVRQIVVVSANRVAGLTVDDGRLLLEHSWVNFNGISVAQPLMLGNDRIFISAGYGH